MDEQDLRVETGDILLQYRANLLKTAWFAFGG